jgi:hypothetical protein
VSQWLRWSARCLRLDWNRREEQLRTHFQPCGYGRRLSVLTVVMLVGRPCECWSKRAIATAGQL